MKLKVVGVTLHQLYNISVYPILQRCYDDKMGRAMYTELFGIRVREKFNLIITATNAEGTFAQIDLTEIQVICTNCLPNLPDKFEYLSMAYESSLHS